MVSSTLSDGERPVRCLFVPNAPSFCQHFLPLLLLEILEVSAAQIHSVVQGVSRLPHHILKIFLKYLFRTSKLVVRPSGVSVGLKALKNNADKTFCWVKKVRRCLVPKGKPKPRAFKLLSQVAAKVVIGRRLVGKAIMQTLPCKAHL